MSKPRHIAVLFACLLTLSACEGTKKQLGLTRNAPDEFAVVKRAPLEIPSDYTLPPPQPGAPRPQEKAPEIQAKRVIFGETAISGAAAPTQAEAALLQQAGADTAEPGIRNVVDRETATLAPREVPVAEKLLGIGGGGDKPPATVVDAKAEAERLKQNMEEGKPVTEGKTPVIRQ